MSLSGSLLALTLLVSTNPATTGNTVGDFSLDDFRGRTHALSDFTDAKIVVICFLGTECPLAKLYGPRLEKLHQEYGGKGVTFVGIDSNCQDSISEMASFARRHSITFPLLKDPANRVADQLQAERTPEVIVLDQNRCLAYRGRIDDQYGVGYSRPRRGQMFLRQAIDALLSGNDVPVSSTEAVGCYIGRIREPSNKDDVTYSNQIARLFQKHCVECHRDGEIAPFALSQYDEVVGWAETIAEVVRDQRMPPWHANPDHGQFANARHMSPEEKESIYRWVRDGAPRGDPTELPLPRQFVRGWRLPKEPDLVIPMRKKPFSVAAEETIEYQYFIVDPGFQEDKWVQAAEVIPGNRAVVHHAIVFVRPPGNVEGDDIGWLSAYVPGQRSTNVDPERAICIPAGSKLVFQMHYTPNGSPQEDLTKVGLVFTKAEKVKERIVTLIALDRDFEIPPFAGNHTVTTVMDRLPRNGQLLALAPHMHVRGKSFRFVAHRGGRSSILLDVPGYDFNWQHSYELDTPIPVGDDLEIECIAKFDNSENNLANPDPSVTVRWGDQTWEEMAVAYFGVAVPLESADTSSSSPAETLTGEQLAEAESMARSILERFDHNGDSEVDQREVPESFAVFAFHRFDKDGNDSITLDEARAEARRSIQRRTRRVIGR